MTTSKPRPLETRCVFKLSLRSNVEIRLGEHNLWEPEGTEQYIMSAQFIRHPDYSSRTQDSDIMLIKLSQPATLNSYVRPAALPKACGVDGTVCHISGWGSLRPSNEGCELCPAMFFLHVCGVDAWV